MKVSVVVPTYGRPQHHEGLHALFAAQTHPDRELLVYDDSPEPSPFFTALRDPRVRYHHHPERVALGSKRNWLAAEATGEVLAHFDDDDFYAPGYLAHMVAALDGADLVKLGAFHVYSVGHALLAYWDQTTVGPRHFRVEHGKPVAAHDVEAMAPAARELWGLRNLLGYGFSYVYRRALWERVPFPAVSHGEDFAFVEAALGAGARFRHVRDESGLALYVRHAADHSVMFPQYLLPPHLLGRLLGREAEAFASRAAHLTRSPR